MVESQTTILVVDDEIKVLRRLEALLLPRGYRVITASNGAEALQRVQQEPPDLIVLDVLMPDMDGFAVCRRLKDNSETSLIPVLLMTVLSDAKDRITGFEAGADDFLSKPVHRDELLARIRALLRRRQTINGKVQALQQQLREVSERQSHVLTTMSHLSHDLRTQLDTVIGFAEVLQEQACGALNATQEEYVTYILTSGTRVLTLVNGLLDLARMEAGELGLHLEVLALKPLCEESLRLLRGWALAHDLSLSLEVANDVDTIVADVHKVKQILFNLLCNAVQCTPDHGRVGMKATQTPAGVQIAVWDTGAEMTPAEQARIFEAWPQVLPGQATPSAKTGCGLALTKKLVELHGGTIKVDSQPGQGRTFTCVLPHRSNAPHSPA
jgi:signal transduction histidine kinase